MRRIPLASLIVLAGIVRAAEVAPSVPADAPPRSGAIETAAAKPAAAKHVISPLTTAKLIAAVPRYAPPVPQPPATESPVSPIVQMPEKPQNQVIRLPQFFVGEPKIHVPTPLQVLTPKGRVELGFQMHPGLRLVPLGWMNAGVAGEMIEDDLQASRRAAEANLWSLYLVK